MKVDTPANVMSADTDRQADTPVGRRLVLFLPGHDPTDMDYHYGRFANQAGRFAKLWSVHVDVSERIDDDRQHIARWDVTSSGPNWREQVDYRVLRWEDIVVALDERPNPVRLVRGLGGLFDFWAGGAARRYAEVSAQYIGFFLFPIVIIGLFALGGLVVGALTHMLLAPLLPRALALAAAALATVGAFFGLFWQPGRSWRLHQALDDWDLARNYLHGRTPTVTARLDQFADEVIEAVKSGRYDEVLLVGHSLGATLILGVIERALDREPDLTAGPTRLALLTCGATIPKFALHRAGETIRRQARRVAEVAGLTWVEFQSEYDVINFFAYHPVLLKPMEFTDTPEVQPLLREANVKAMLTSEKFRRIRLNPMRLHYQFLLANEIKAPYDFFMFALGPLSFADITSRPEGPVGRFAPDGSLLAPSSLVMAH